jgi:hypothetical protein
MHMQFNSVLQFIFIRMRYNFIDSNHNNPEKKIALFPTDILTLIKFLIIISKQAACRFQLWWRLPMRRQCGPILHHRPVFVQRLAALRQLHTFQMRFDYNQKTKRNIRNSKFNFPFKQSRQTEHKRQLQRHLGLQRPNRSDLLRRFVHMQHNAVLWICEIAYLRWANSWDHIYNPLEIII